MVGEEDRDDEQEEVGARAFWSGTITFGLVSIPVDLFAANRARRVSLRMLAPDGTPLRREYVCPKHKKPIPSEELVRGYPIDEDTHVVVTEEELAALAPRKSRDIELVQFVKEEELPPLFFERAYFLLPAGESTKSYRLLAATMEKSRRVGIATFVMRGKSYVVAIIAERGILRAETLRHADEVRSAEEVGLENLPKAKPGEVKKIRDRIKKRTERDIDVDELRDRWAERVLALAEEKRAEGSGVVELSEDLSREHEVVDIMSVLKERLGAHTEEKKPAKKKREAVASRSKQELYDRAKSLGIPGRSKMSRSELIDAIRHAS